MNNRKSLIKRKIIPAVSAAYFYLLSLIPVTALAADGSDTGVGQVTSGIRVIKDLVLGCVGGVGVIFLAWGILDFGTAYASRQTSEQSEAIKKVIGGLIMVAVPAILKVLGVS